MVNTLEENGIKKALKQFWIFMKRKKITLKMKKYIKQDAEKFKAELEKIHKDNENDNKKINF